MTEQERIEALLTALETALGLIGETMHYTVPMYFDDISSLNGIYDSWATLEAYAKHEREKQGTMTMSNEVIEEKNESVGE